MITVITIRNEQEFNQVKAKLIEGGFGYADCIKSYSERYTFFYVYSEDKTVKYFMEKWHCDYVMSAKYFLDAPATLDGWKEPKPAPKKMTVAEVCEKLGYEVEIVK